MTVSRITVLLVDDHAVVRAGYRHLLERDGRIMVVGEAADVP
ncbi:MAG: DNA-binding response regulator, partial [Burkholderiaceae bacterium]|nr:DNA-binding response regulator [Burkholderiaceae bacterium]